MLVLLSGCGGVRSAAPDLPLAEFTLSAGTLEGPDTLPAGPTTIQLRVTDGALDQVALVRIEEGHTVPEFLTATEVAYPPFWAHFGGGPDGVLPGGVGQSVLNLTPGQWVVLAFDIGPEGFPRVRHQVSRPLVVVANPAPHALPEPAYTLALFDYGFLISAPLVGGTHVLDVGNLAPQRHEAILARLAPGHNAEEMASWLLARRRGEAVGEAPGEVVAGVAALTQSEHNFLTVTVSPGEYALICLLADDGDGRSHLEHGHIQRFTVVETPADLPRDSQ